MYDARALPRYVHQESVDHDVDRDFVYIALVVGVGEAGGERHAHGEGGDDCGEETSSGGGARDLVVRVGFLQRRTYYRGAEDQE